MAGANPVDIFRALLPREPIFPKSVQDFMKNQSYFDVFSTRPRPGFVGLSRHTEAAWHGLVGITIGLGAWYLIWRWTESLNADAPVFSTVVVLAESAAFLGSVLFFYDIWSEGDTPMCPPPANRPEAGLKGEGPIRVDIFITTVDEGCGVVEASLKDAADVVVPQNTLLTVNVLDDGDQPGMAELAKAYRANHIVRIGNSGFKAGNMANALYATNGDFIVICDADTRLFPEFLVRTLGYFRDPKVAWVQTPHWFYDIPRGTRLCSHRIFSGRRLSRALALRMERLLGKKRFGQDPCLLYTSPSPRDS